MKKNILRRIAPLPLLLCLLLGLSACSSGTDTKPAPTAAPTARTGGNGAGSGYASLRSLWLLDSPVYTALASHCTASWMWTVPRDVLSQAALDLTGAAGEAEGEYTLYTVSVSADSAYTATGMDPGVLEAHAEDDPGEEDLTGEGEMVTDLMGDFAHRGGGEYLRTALWRIKNGNASGTAKMSLSLNGETSGREQFAFCVSGGLLYFYDVTENVTVFDEEGSEVNEPNWLVTRGFVGEDSARIEEYTDITDALPDPESLISRPVDGSRSGAALLVFEKGRGTVSRGGEVLQEFTVP